MEVLVVELSKLLNITIEKAIELFPIIQKEFLYYKIINVISNPIILLTIFSSIILLIVLIFWLIEWDFDGYNNFPKYKKIISINSIIIIISSIVLVILKVSIYILSPNFMIIKEFLLK